MEKRLTDFAVGAHISFVYHGGSNPGTTRRVEVLEVLPNAIRAKDLDKPDGDNIRMFTNNYARNICVMAQVGKKKGDTTKEVFFTDVQKEVAATLNETKLAALYKEMTGADDVSYDAGRGVFVVQTRDKSALTVKVANTSGVDFDVVNSRGETLDCSILIGNRLRVHTTRDMSVKDFVEKLAKHLDLV